MKRKNKFSDWREDLIEVVGIPEQEPKTDTDSEKEITEKKIKNKITINPSMKEAFEEIGGILLEVTELDEKMDMKKADMGEVKEVQERTLTPGEKEEKEDIVKGMKKDKGGFEKRYGKDAKSVMYATATKLAKEETEDGLRDKRQMYGGVDGSNRYNKPVSNTPNTFGKKKPAGGLSALERVKANIRAKHGKGAIKDV
jgi:hypothetical protein